MLEPVRHEKEMIRVHADDILGHVVVPDDRGRADNECLAGTPPNRVFFEMAPGGITGRDLAAPAADRCQIRMKWPP
jgi:hypothetical protein